MKRVLQDVHCTGDSVFGKYQQSVFQGNKQRNRPESEWLHVENTHEGIIDRELFQQVQSKIQEYTEAYKKRHQQNNGAIRNHNFYTGKIWCGGCGNRMTLSRERNGTFFYICGANTNHKSGGKQCKGHRVRKEYVDDDVLRLIQTHMKTVLDTEKMIQEMNTASKNQTQYLLLDKEVGKLRQELSRISKRKSDLYEDYSERLITEEEYIQFSRIYSNEIENIKSRLDTVLAAQVRYSQDYHIEEGWGNVIHQVQFQRFDTIKKKHWSPTTVAAIVRDEIYIGTRIWGKTRCSMHTGHKAVLNDETEWVRLENHHTAIIDRALFEKASEMHPKKKRSVAESRTNFTLERRKKQPALLLCANCGHSLLKETEHLLKCSDARTNGDPVCRSLVIRREPLEENILGLVHQYAASMLEKEKKVSAKRQCDYKEINTSELQKQSRQLTSEKMKLYDDYKDGRIDRDLYKQRAEKISVQLDEIKRKIEDAENSKKLLEQNELSDKIKLKDFLGIQKFDTEKLREIIKVIRVHSQDEIEIEWNFDDIFSEQR